MKKHLLLTSLILAVFCAVPNSGRAATFVSLIDFPASTFSTDTQSGNGIDYVYEHLLSELNVPDTTITSGTLELRHLGNQDFGPTAEIWYTLSGSGTFIGRLGGSDPKERTDHFELSQGILAEITAQNPWKFKIGLSEQTSFNNERLTLLQSKLQVDYTRTSPPSTNTPTIPEPSSSLLLALGLLATMILRITPLLIVRFL